MIWQKVENGKVIDNTAEATSASKKREPGKLDKEDFLNLLVAQMKYQDPLEPQSNTEYVSQLATFTQVEATENMAHTAESLQANALVGKTVIMRPTNPVTGEQSLVTGVVDYVMKEGSNIYLSVGGALYNLDDLYSVADSEYMEATMLAEDFEKTVEQLPDANNVSLLDEQTFKMIREQFDKLSDYQKEFIQSNCKEAWDKFLAAETALNVMIKLRVELLNGGAGDDTTGGDKDDDAAGDGADKGDGAGTTTPTE